MIGVLARAVASPMLWSMASTGVRAVVGVLVLAVALAHLDAPTIGIWYLFVGIGSLLGRCDFGFGSTILRASARLRMPGTDPGRIGSFARAVGRLYVGLALVGSVILLGGTVYLLRHLGSPMVWGAWLLYSIGVLAGLLSGGDQAIASGGGRIRGINQIAVIASLLAGAATLMGFHAGLGIAAMGLGTMIQGVAVAAGAWWCARGLRPDRTDDREPSLWWREWWPASWRTGITGLGAFLIYYSNTFLAAGHLGLAEAGCFGFTTAVFTLLLALSVTPVTVAVPQFAAAFHSGERTRAWGEFRRRRRLAILVYGCVAAMVVFAGDHLLHLIGSRSSFLPREPLLALAIIFGLELNHTLYANLVMAADEVPFALPAILSGIGVAVVGGIGVACFGLWGLVLGVGLVQAAWNNWYPVWYCHARLGEGGSHAA